MTEPEKFPAWTDTGRRMIAGAHRDSEFGSALRNFTFSDYASATNGGTSVIELIGPIVIGEGCLIVTGYQDLLSALSIIMEVRPGITFEAPGSIRILFGTNTDNLRFLTGPRQALPEHVKRHYTLQTGVFVRDTRDLRALQAREAIRSGAISIRIFDEEKAQKDLGRPAGMMHANLFLNDEFAVAGSANFSRHGMASNIEFADRAMAGSSPAHEERRKAGESFWSWGVDWNGETIEILDRLLREVSPQEALGRTLEELLGFQAWRTASSEMSSEQEDLVYAAAQSVYEHGLALLTLPPGASRSLVGRSLGAMVGDMYERCVMRDDGPSSRRQGALALVEPASEASWRRGRRGALRILPTSAEKGLIASEVDAVAAILVEEAEHGAGRLISHKEPSHILPPNGAHWVAAMMADLPGGLAAEPALELIETAGGPAMGHELAEELMRSGSPLFPTRTGKRAKKSGPKQEEAQASLLEALGPMRATLNKEMFAPKYTAIRFKPGPAIQAQMKNIEACLGEALEAEEGRDEVISAATDLTRCLAVSIKAARQAWDDGLASRLAAAPGGTASSQGMLPMFAASQKASDSDAADRLRDALFSRELDGLDRARLETVFKAASKPGRIALIAETEEEAACLARAADVMEDRQVLHLGDQAGAIPSESEADHVVAAGETIGRRAVLHCKSSDVETHLSESEDGCILILKRQDLFGLDLSLLHEIVLMSAAPNLKAMACLADFFGERQSRGKAPLLKCLVMEGLPFAGSKAAIDKAFKAASLGGCEGRIGPDLVCPDAVLGRLAGSSRARQGRHLVDEIEALRPFVGSACAAPDARGAELAVLSGVAQPFTAYVLAGKTGRRGEPFMPPRLVVVKQGEKGDEIVRGQIPALALVRSAFADGNAPADKAGVNRSDTLETISRHLAQITHWDVRPERVRVLLSSLASFMNGTPMECDGASVLGDLTLPSLELVADRWATHLFPIAGRLRATSEDRRAQKGLYDPLLDISQVERAIRERPGWEVEGVKSDMSELIEDLRFADREKVKTIQDRVVVVIRALP
jgi:hypothetical protein